MLWQATRSATPILLLARPAAWLLANAILRDSDAEMSGNRVLRIAALVLALAVLPLTVFAAVSLGTRIAQHGLSPERLWGLVAIAVAAHMASRGWSRVIRGRKGGAWRERLRRANLHLAVVDLRGGAVSRAADPRFRRDRPRQQLGRLESGTVSAEDFDYEALRWDFGARGPARARAARHEQEHARSPTSPDLHATRDRADMAQLRRAFRRRATRINVRASARGPCAARLVVDYLRANRVAVRRFLRGGRPRAGSRRFARSGDSQGGGYQRVRIPATGPVTMAPQVTPAAGACSRPASKVEIRTIERRYIIVDGKPIGEPVDRVH